MAKWVCSKWNTEPKDSEKWEVLSENKHEYVVRAKDGNVVLNEYVIPKRDYVECPGPEVWRDVTDRLQVTDGNWPKGGPESYSNGIQEGCYILWKATCYAKDYRLRKVQLLKGCLDETSCPGDPTIQQWAFIVEKKEGV